LQAAILYNLKTRHSSERPYTRTGDILIAVNPYQWIDELYTEEKRTYYSNRLVWDRVDSDPRATIQPHVYEVSALSYKGLATGGRDQSILVSGESGAGKTETVKICLNHIASVQRGQAPAGYYESSDKNPIVQRVVQSNPLLEAFGNAKTRRNDNSSRFGKYLQLQFDNKVTGELGIKNFNCSLAGSTCDVYLLEKNRVISHDLEERTFHIFYQLLAAPDAVKTQFWQGLKGSTNISFRYVGFTDTTSIEGMTDAERFKVTIEALQLVGIEGQKLDMMMKALCIVLQLGNLVFDSLNGDDDKSKVATKDELKALAELMGVEEKDLAIAFTERTFITQNESHKVPLNREMARDACDALAKECYQKVFLWVAGAINEANSAKGGKKYGHIGLLDIFGFEVFEVNRFEQLCINYANEKLQQKFTEDIFKSVQAEYEVEGIPLHDIWYDDNTNVLDLIEGPTGLLALLNEECVRPKGNDFEYVQKALQINKSSPCLVPNRTDRLSFAINHYAGGVMYDGDMFVASNVDSLPMDLRDCAASSSNEILNKPREEPAPRLKNQYGRRALTPKTVWTKYRTQLFDLMETLKKTDSRYIRCIKPNDKKKPLVMNHNNVIDQLRCAGVVAGITITRSVFPNRLPNTLVLARYSSMCDKFSHSSGNLTPEEKRAADCKTLLTWALKEKETADSHGRTVKAFAVGKTKTYFRAGALEWLESYRSQGLDVHAVTIQKAARGWLARNTGKNVKQRQRMEELHKEQLKQENLARSAQLLKDAAQRKAERLREQHQYMEEIAKLEKAIKVEDVQSREKLASARERAVQLQCEVDEFKEDLADAVERELRGGRATKARQEKRLEEASKLIEFLKKENRRLRKSQAKIEGKHEDVEGNSTKLSESFSCLNSSLSNIGEGAFKVEAKNGVLVNTLDDHKSRNKGLKVKVMEAQDRYMGMAEGRLELQKAMARILTSIQERCTDADLVEEAVVVALEAETEAKCIMMELDTNTTEPSLLMSDVSDSTRSTGGHDEYDHEAELEFSEHEM
jgi:myosin V